MQSELFQTSAVAEREDPKGARAYSLDGRDGLLRTGIAPDPTLLDRT